MGAPFYDQFEEQGASVGRLMESACRGRARFSEFQDAGNGSHNSKPDTSCRRIRRSLRPIEGSVRPSFQTLGCCEESGDR
jgi:hypothetical protein